MNLQSSVDRRGTGAGCSGNEDCKFKTEKRSACVLNHTNLQTSLIIFTTFPRFRLGSFQSVIELHVSRTMILPSSLREREREKEMEI